MSIETRIPFFTFSDQEVGVDAEATKEAGYEVPKVVTVIEILAHGHRAPSSFAADEFISRKTEEAKAGRYDPRWVAEFKEGLDAYRKGREIPRTGTPLITWERIIKSRRVQLAPQFPTIEDLAACPDSSLGLIGLDGRVLRDMAAAELQAKKDLAPVVRELADAKEENRRLSDRLEAVTHRLEVLEAAQSNKRNRAEAA